MIFSFGSVIPFFFYMFVYLNFLSAFGHKFGLTNVILRVL